MGHKDLTLGQIFYILVFDNISFSWLLPLDRFQFIFLLRDSEKDLLGGYARVRGTLGKQVMSHICADAQIAQFVI